MSNRTKTGQKQHDRAVINWVKKMKADGFNVEADLPKMSKPTKIGGDIPDAIAKKGNVTKVLEVETSDSMATDKEQRAKFRKWSKQSNNRTFVTKVIRKK